MGEYRKLTAKITRGSMVLEQVSERPVRVLPDGRSGVVYAGDVYPLRKSTLLGDHIDLNDEVVAKSECMAFVSVDEPIVYATSDGLESTSAGISLKPSRWAIETNRFGHYFVFDGSEAQAEAVIERLESEGLEVRRWDASSRPADDGYFYDWFARLVFDGTNENCREAVSSALSETGRDTGRGHAPSAPQAAMTDAQSISDVLASIRGAVLALRIQRLERQTDELLKGAQEIEAKRADESARLKKLTADLHRAENSLEAERAKARRLAAELEALRQVSGQGTNARVRASQGAISDLEARLAESERVRLELSTEVDQALDWISDHEDNIRSLEQERSELLERLEESEEKLSREMSSSVPARKRARDNPLRTRAWRRLVLDDLTLEAMNDPGQFKLLPDLLELLFRLDKGDVGSRCWDGTPVFEVNEHVNTGVKSAENLGRVYYAKKDDGRLLVFAHRKVDEKRQRQFVKRISSRAIAPIEEL
jgi:hypothetical protein